MHPYPLHWDSDTAALFQAIRNYQRACSRYIRGKPSAELAERRLEAAFDDLMYAMSSAKVLERLTLVIAAGATEEERTTESLMQSLHPDDMELEVRMSQIFGLKPKDVTKAVRLDKDDETPLIAIESPDDLIAKLEDFHATLIEETEEARKIGKRGEKKKRKRNIAQAATSILFGSGCAVLNTYALPGMPFMATSYAASLAAFHAALRDIVGERPKD